ncbi:MAG TPA: RNA-binding S4 domain-containing protein [Alphaproteobacteria bacterium]|nr:RNA-binding S4 domain-containing protein [Alphaproteobacteria bacterium]
MSAPIDADRVRDDFGTDSERSAVQTLRVDKWLWFARFFKSRSLATRLCADGKVRINRVVATKAHQPIRPGDVLTFPQGRQIRVIKVIALGVRRGPAVEAQRLYEDLTPEQRVGEDARDALATAVRDPGSGRPTKKERRALDRLGEEG